MRARYPDWAAEIDKAVQGFNEVRPEETDLALSHIAELIAHRRNAQTRELPNRGGGEAHPRGLGLFFRPRPISAFVMRRHQTRRRPHLVLDRLRPRARKP